MSNVINNSTMVVNPSCSMGDYSIDYYHKFLYLCVTGKGRTYPHESIDLNGIYCRYTCSTEGFECTKEIGITRKFDDSANSNA